MKCRVKPGQQLAHGGAVLEGETDVELTAELAYEVRHLVDEVLPTGEVRAIGAGERAAAELQAALASAKPHERISILETARASVAGDLDTLDRAIAAERKRLAAEAKGPANPAPAKPKDDAPTER